MRAIGILGGMFDPIHQGHLLAARAALAAGMDEVLLLPCQTPAHRPAALVPAAERLRMCELAAMDIPGLSASDIDLREGPCYAFDTARLLQKRYPGAALHWIIGADKLPTLHAWHEAQALFALCDFLVCPRPGYDAAYPVPGAKTRVIALEPVDYSSGQVVRSLRALSDAPEALPPSVAKYIAENGLYQPDYASALRARGMTDKRLAHTLGVRQTAVMLAALHGACMQQAAVAAMLHDIAKPLPLPRMQALAAAYRLDLPQDTLADAALLHGPLAAEIARREFGIVQPDVLSAIACHTPGKANMTTLELCLFVADATEPTREDYPGLAQMRALAQTDPPRAALLSMRCKQTHARLCGRRVCPQTDEAIQSIQQIYHL